MHASTWRWHSLPNKPNACLEIPSAYTKVVVSEESHDPKLKLAKVSPAIHPKEGYLQTGVHRMAF